MAIILLLSEGLFQPMAQLATVHEENSSFLYWQRSLAHPEIPDRHELDLILNYTTGDEGIERQLLRAEKGR
jgi:hypothetical protein